MTGFSTFWRVFHFHVSIMDNINTFLKSPSLPSASDGLFQHFPQKSITSICQWCTFWTFFQKVHHSHVSVMDLLYIFPKSPSHQHVSDGLLEHFSNKSISSICQWWSFSKSPSVPYASDGLFEVMDFLNIFPKSPSLPCVRDGLFEHFPKKSITSLCPYSKTVMDFLKSPSVLNSDGLSTSKKSIIVVTSWHTHY